MVGRGILDSSEITRGDDKSCEPSPLFKKLKELGFCDIDGYLSTSLCVYDCKNILIDGIVIRDAPFWTLIVRNNSENVVIDNVKIIGSWRYNADGIDICTSDNVKVRNSFIRTFDDCLVARGRMLPGEGMNTRNLEVENCVLWCDWGKAMEIWAITSCLIENISFRNCRVIHTHVASMDITTCNGSSNIVIRNINFEDIEVDLDPVIRSPFYQKDDSEVYKHDPSWRGDLALVTAYLGDPKYESWKTQDLTYKNIMYKNIRQVGDGTPLNVTLENRYRQLVIDGVRLENVERDELRAIGEVKNLSDVNPRGGTPANPGTVE